MRTLAFCVPVLRTNAGLAVFTLELLAKFLLRRFLWLSQPASLMLNVRSKPRLDCADKKVSAGSDPHLDGRMLSWKVIPKWRLLVKDNAALDLRLELVSQ